MATMITRTVKTYKATKCAIEMKDGAPTIVMGDEIAYTAPSENDAAARAAFKAAGIACPRGTQFVHELISEVTYGMPVDIFMKHAQPITD